ncbi:unnamed protein product [Symbiodinium pilosum]|uniref:Uncharacterized protein n=1 Tax=Symbiodinium pilosum TaxID=2952 RepID=A0A812KEB0_SYMPI|nr:unnamed protein product [Symbiodinium pilosum]
MLTQFHETPDSNDLTLWAKPDTFVGNVAKKWLKDSPTLTQGNRADFCGIQLTAHVPCYVLLCAVCCPREIGVPLTGWRIQRAQGESLAFRGVGPLFPIPENEVWFDDFNDLDGAGKTGLTWGEIYKYRVVAVNGIDVWDDESASDYTIVRCSNEAPEVPWWLQLNATTTTTTTTAASNETFVADLVTGFVWSIEATTTTTTPASVDSSYAFFKLADVDPRDCYLPQNMSAEYYNYSESIVQALQVFDVPPPPLLSVAWSACNTSARSGDPCKEFFPDRSDVVACARLEFRPTQPAQLAFHLLAITRCIQCVTST